MNAVKGEKYFNDKLFDLGFSKWHPLLHPNQLSKVSSITVFLFDAYLILFNKAVEAADYMWMIFN